MPKARLSIFFWGQAGAPVADPVIDCAGVAGDASGRWAHARPTTDARTKTPEPRNSRRNSARATQVWIAESCARLRIFSWTSVAVRLNRVESFTAVNRRPADLAALSAPAWPRNRLPASAGGA